METKSITDYLQQLKDIETAIQFGVLPNDIGIVIHKFTGRLDVDTTQRILSSCYNENPFNENALQLYISSSSELDNQYIVLEGIDQNFNVIYTTISLNGTTAVPIPTIYRTLWRGYNNNSIDINGTVYIGSEPTPVNGIPSVNNQFLVINGILNAKLINQSLTSIFTIPSGYTGFITRWDVTPGKSADKLDFTAYFRMFQKAWRYRDRITTHNQSIQKELPYIKVPEKTDIKIMVSALLGTSTASATYDIILINNEYLQKTRTLYWR